MFVCCCSVLRCFERTAHNSKQSESNERDRNLLLPLFLKYNFTCNFILKKALKLEGPLFLFLKPEEDCGNNRSVMPSDVPGCTRATMIVAVSIYFQTLPWWIANIDTSVDMISLFRITCQLNLVRK